MKRQTDLLTSDTIFIKSLPQKVKWCILLKDEKKWEKAKKKKPKKTTINFGKCHTWVQWNKSHVKND
jgi:hypothetical protein